MSERWVIRGARVVDPASGHDAVTDVAIADGQVVAVGTAAADAGGTAIDASGFVLAPGLVDMHTHLREPGFEHKETIETGTRAAALGGFTAVAPMANTDPVADAAAVVHEVRARALAVGLCDVYPVGAITRGLRGEEMSEIGELYASGVRVISDDGHVVPNARVLRNALTYSKAFPGLVIAEHCEDPSLGEGGLAHEGVMSASLGLAGVPAEAEEIIVSRDIALARLTGGRIHICHVSAAGSVALIRRAKAEGVAVTAEVTPHHLSLTHDALGTYDTSLRVNPPLRSQADREALREGLADGTIDAVATDHAPHAPEEKEAEFDQVPPGTIGLETALAVVLTDLVEPGLLDMGRAIEALSSAPARILGADGHGGPIAAGAPANLVLFDPAAIWTVAPPFASRSRNSAFTGRELRGRVVATFLRGTPTVLDGKAVR